MEFSRRRRLSTNNKQNNKTDYIYSRSICRVLVSKHFSSNFLKNGLRAHCLVYDYLTSRTEYACACFSYYNKFDKTFKVLKCTRDPFLLNILARLEGIVKVKQFTTELLKTFSVTLKFTTVSVTTAYFYLSAVLSALFFLLPPLNFILHWVSLLVQRDVTLQAYVFTSHKPHIVQLT